MITDRQSPNFSARPPGFDIDLLILHYTGMGSCKDAIDRLCDPEAKVSSHYLIDEDGTVHQLVTEDKTAWHAGQSCWEGKIGMNQRSVGIELVNPGHEHGYRDFPEAQMTALEKLCQQVLSRHPIPRRQVLGHSDIAPMRKDDPGELFPWERLAKQGIGLWPQQTDMEPVPAQIRDVQNALRSIGYCIPVDGQDSPVYRAILKAFQRHWRPKKVDGSADKATRQMIAAVQVAIQADMAANPPKGGACDH
ncbi:MAG: N-acetylmuramoyl-L-alanine amidase [Sphingomonadales bacterium]